MAPIDANRKAQIEALVANAVNQKLAATDKIQSNEDLKSAKNDSVSIFIDDDMSKAEKDYAFKFYAQTLLKKYYDKDQNGEITVEEFALKEYENNKKLAQTQRDNVIAQRSAHFTAEQMDIDGDGKISVDEFTYFRKSADKADGNQDGIIRMLGEFWQIESITGQNAKNATVKAVVEEYLTGENLTEEDQTYLSAAARNIRNSQALDAANTYGIRLDETKTKTIYLGDSGPYTDEADQATDGSDNPTDPDDATDIPSYEDKTKKAQQPTTPVFEDQTKSEPIPVFNDKTKYTLRGLNQNTMNPYGMYGFSTYYTQPKPNKLFQLGNIIGNAFNLFFMGKFLFGQNDSMGGLRWWF